MRVKSMGLAMGFAMGLVVTARARCRATNSVYLEIDWILIQYEVLQLIRAILIRCLMITAYYQLWEKDQSR